MNSRTSAQPHFEHFFGKPTSDGRRELARCYHVTADWRAGWALRKLGGVYSRRPYTNNALPAETATYCLPPTA